MTLKIDKAGRIVLPKPVRDRLRLKAGSRLSMEEKSGGILLRPIGQQTSLMQRQRLLIHRGKAAEGFDWDRLIDDQHNERIKDVHGL